MLELNVGGVLGMRASDGVAVGCCLELGWTEGELEDWRVGVDDGAFEPVDDGTELGAAKNTRSSASEYCSSCRPVKRRC